MKRVTDATCAFCGCVCDDIHLVVRENHIAEVENACELGETWFLASHTEDRAACTIRGCPAPVEHGIDQAARILTDARYPVVYGLGGTTCEAQCKATAIADWIGGTVDTTTGDCLGPARMAFQSVGAVTATLGEVRHRADLVIYWGCNPAESHPRHFARHTLTPQGLFVKRGRRDRTCVVIDVRRTRSVGDADIYVPIKPGKDFEALWTLRVAMSSRKGARAGGEKGATWVQE